VPSARRRLLAVVVVTVVLTALAFGFDRSRRAPTTAPSAEAGMSTPVTDVTTTTVSPPPEETSTSTSLEAGALAPTGRFTAASGTGPTIGTGTRFTYTVEVEDGVPVDPAAFAEEVEAILSDARGWTAAGDVALQRVGPEQAPTFRVRLATPATTDVRCAPLATNGLFSCRNGEDVMINLFRWAEGAAPSGLPLEDYRRYLISHEVGHVLGHEHVACPGPGRPAPVMLQQTKGLQGCSPNPWPFP
jgi:hypothetical protein